MKLITMFLGLLISSGLFAKKYACEELNSSDQIAVYIDLEVGKACYFDNDNCDPIPVKRDAQGIYLFVGHAPNTVGDMVIIFNETLMSVSVMFEDSSSINAEMHSTKPCREDSNIIVE